MEFSCRHCGQPIQADDALVGAEGNCPECGQLVVIPSRAMRAKPRAMSPELLAATFHEPEEKAPALALTPLGPAAAQQAAAPAAPSAALPDSPAKEKSPSKNLAAMAPPLPPPLKEAALRAERRTLGRFRKKARETESTEAAEDTDDAGSKSSMATLVTAVLAVVAVMISPLETFASSMAAKMGGVLIILVGAVVIAAAAGVVIGVLAFLFNLRFKAAFHSTYSFVVVIIGFFGLLANFSLRGGDPAKDKKAAQQMVAMLESQLHSFTPDPVAVDVAPSAPPAEKSAPVLAVAPEAENTGEKLLDFMRRFSSDMSHLRQEYHDSIEATGLSRLLDPNRLADDPNLAQSREIHANAVRVVGEYKERAESLLTDFPTRLESFGVDGVTKRIVAKGFEWAVENAAPQFRENWEIEQQTINHMGEVIHLLEKAKGNWAIENGGYSFDRREDLQRFNEIMAQIDAGAQRQAQIREQSANSAGAMLEKLKKGFLQ